MGEKLTINIAAVSIVLMLPFLITIFINGRQADIRVNQINSGKDVLVVVKGENVLMDVEEYIVGVLPGLVDYDSDMEVIEAQAVAVRTKIYYAMNGETMIRADSLEYEYFGGESIISKEGRNKYKTAQTKYERAVVNTAGKTIK